MLNVLKVAAARSPLRSGAFARLWLGLSISYLGDQFTTIALLWFVLQLTGSGAAVSLVILCFQLPGMLTGPLLGTLLDRWQPRLVMGIDNCVRALLIGSIPALYLSGFLQLWHIYILALFAGVLSPATGAGVRVVLPHFVAEDALERANALSSTSMQFAALLGPALAGVVVTRIGCSWAPYTPIETSLLQRLIPPALRGQVFGSRLAVITAAAPLGTLVGGLLLQFLSPPIVIGISGVACVLAGAGGLLSPTLRNLSGKVSEDELAK